jgi:hypothetical protein
MTILARGTFDVNITTQPPEDKTEGITLGRMLIEKKFQGDLAAVSSGLIADGKRSYEFACTLPRGD